MAPLGVDWRTELKSHYMRNGVWQLSADMDAFLIAHTNPGALREENEFRRTRGCAYTEANWLRPTYRQWYLAYYSSRYLSHVQRTLLDSWPAEDFDVGLSILDVGVGPGTTALAVMDLCNTAEGLGLLRNGGHPRFIAIDRDEEKLDYAYDTAFAFAEQCELRAGQALGWTRAFAAGSDWYVLDVGAASTLEAWPEERKCQVVVVSNTYTELCRQGNVAEAFTARFLPRVLGSPWSVNAFEPLLPRGGDEYKRSLCRFAADVSQSAAGARGLPCSGTVAGPGACGAGNACEDHYSWRRPSVLEPFFGSGVWNEGSLRITISGSR